MTKKLKSFVLIGVFGSALMAAGFSARADSHEGDAPQDKSMRHDHEEKFSAADRAAFFDARIAAMHAALTLTPDQEKLWPPVESAYRDLTKTMVEQHQAMRDAPQSSDLAQKLQRMSANTLARGQALKTLSDAVTPLYASLTEEQKHRVPVLLAHMHPRMMHMARDHEDGERGPRHWSHEHDRYDHNDDGDNDHDDRRP